MNGTRFSTCNGSVDSGSLMVLRAADESLTYSLIPAVYAGTCERKSCRRKRPYAPRCLGDPPPFHTPGLTSFLVCKACACVCVCCRRTPRRCARSETDYRSPASHWDHGASTVPPVPAAEHPPACSGARGIWRHDHATSGTSPADDLAFVVAPTSLFPAQKGSPHRSRHQNLQNATHPSPDLRLGAFGHMRT